MVTNSGIIVCRHDRSNKAHQISCPALAGSIIIPGVTHSASSASPSCVNHITADYVAPILVKLGTLEKGSHNEET